MTQRTLAMPGNGYRPTVAGVPIRIDKTAETPTYLQLAGEIKRLISENALPVDEDSGRMKLPSIHELVRDTGLAYNTVQKAIGALKAEGIVRTSPGRGVFVR